MELLASYAGRVAGRSPFLTYPRERALGYFDWTVGRGPAQLCRACKWRPSIGAGRQRSPVGHGPARTGCSYRRRADRV